MSDATASNGIEIKTPWVTLEGTGLVTIMLFLTVLMIGFVGYVGYTMQQEHAAIVAGLNDVFIATLTPPTQKENLPWIMQEKLREKVEEKARRHLQE